MDSSKQNSFSFAAVVSQPQQVNWERMHTCVGEEETWELKDKQFDLLFLPISSGHPPSLAFSLPLLPLALCWTNPFWRDK